MALQGSFGFNIGFRWTPIFSLLAKRRIKKIDVEPGFTDSRYLVPNFSFLAKRRMKRRFDG